MPDKKRTERTEKHTSALDNEIKKALECCTRGRKGEEIPCADCSYDECNIVGGTSERQTNGTCQSWLMKDCFDLINRLQAENERLEHQLETLCLALRLAKAEAYKEVLTIINEYYNKHIFGDNDLEAAEKDAVINFSDDITYRLNNLLKELVGDT